jgi:hypothetical protein
MQTGNQELDTRLEVNRNLYALAVLSTTVHEVIKGLYGKVETFADPKVSTAIRKAIQSADALHEAMARYRSLFDDAAKFGEDDFQNNLDTKGHEIYRLIDFAIQDDLDPASFTLITDSLISAIEGALNAPASEPFDFGDWMTDAHDGFNLWERLDSQNFIWSYTENNFTVYLGDKTKAFSGSIPQTREEAEMLFRLLGISVEKEATE